MWKVREGEIITSDKFKVRVERFLRANRDVVANSDKELGQTHTSRIKFNIGYYAPIKLSPYRTPIHKRPVVDETVKEMLISGIVERSKFLWSFPIELLDKKDRGHRFCVDFRKLNPISKPLAVPLPLIDDILAFLVKTKYFPKIDFRSGYWQVAFLSCTVISVQFLRTIKEVRIKVEIAEMSVPQGEDKVLRGFFYKWGKD